MNITTKNFVIYSWLLSSVWARKPVIISSLQIEDANKLLEELFNFIPQYRQLIICGSSSRKLSNGRKSYYLSYKEDKSILKNSILASFEEEKNTSGTYPLQLICFDVKSPFVEQILNHIDRGWIASTEIPIVTLQTFFPNEPFEIYPLNSASIVFLKTHPKRLPVESRLIESYLHFSELTAYNFIQKKMANIRYIAQLLLSEIERGKTFEQAEVEDLFRMDPWNFYKCLKIIESEFYINVNKYFRFR